MTTEIIKELISNNNKIIELLNRFNKLYIDSGNDIEITEENILYAMTSSKNQKRENKNKTTIDLGNCEEELKSSYEIEKDESLYIIKIDITEIGVNIPKIEYLVYYPLYNETLIELDLKKCEGLKIDISIPVNINENNLDIYNKSSDYYNDICTKTTSENGTDITLIDRKNIFVENNMTLCEDDCDLTEYNKTIEKVKCSCNVKISLPILDNIKFNKDKLLKSFIDIRNFANINFMKCYKTVLKGKSLIKNYGFMFYILVIIIFFVSLFLFYFKYYSNIIDTINKISEAN